jgi:hypothetical protein
MYITVDQRSFPNQEMRIVYSKVLDMLLQNDGQYNVFGEKLYGMYIKAGKGFAHLLDLTQFRLMVGCILVRVKITKCTSKKMECMLIMWK